MVRAPLILVVGPSGAGKDALIAGARDRLAAAGRFHFARRMLTRPASAGGEDHDSVPLAEFLEIEAAGGFLLSWRAHGLAYGIPRAVEEFRERGTAVVANVSRSTVEPARRDLAPVGVVAVTAAPAMLAARLGRRGREAPDDIDRRLQRAAAALPQGPDVCLVSNDAELADGIDRFVAALETLRRVASNRP